MWLVGIFGIDQNVIQIYYNKNIKLFSKNLVDIALKTGRSIEKSESHNLVLEVAVLDTKDRFLFITFLYPHLMISTSAI